ncbi:Cdc4 and related F-box and WD-40 proteins [Plasmopara halstedii]|uniref:Cdc4 and related F-box and WD-40 proteins n=1 Tax=Plasmopara halstedii TaxID=4781 RepID=A0A0P1A5W8_PLAHL|nr:Cdc4 and related F-box and WD-40 proteins [Plasmopara halstedii]CEG35956.1 Cdc4 and related F-box and WD-40 proteins [Plasmopara halstedii]|eukprot:XP_024572325.1 Cdc4 and related F-box and WD-40 proteins [Plasmopara halstedii]
MIEFELWETYAHDDASISDGDVAAERTESRPQNDYHQYLRKTLPSIAIMLIPQRNYMAHDGLIMHWPLAQAQNVSNQSKNTLRGHIGAVLTLDFAPDLGPKGLLFSGSADRSIRIWDPWSSVETSSLTTHIENSTAMALLAVVWIGPPRRGIQRWDVLRESTHDGNISMYTQLFESAAITKTAKNVDDNHSSHHFNAKSRFSFKRKFSQYHSLGISRLQLIADNCFVVSLGYDEKAQIIDAISGALSYAICSSKAARFISCTWNERSHTLLLGDAAGYIHLWNIFEDKLVDKRRMVPAPPLAIVGMYMLPSPSGDFLLTGLANGAKQWLINHNAGYAYFRGHTDAVVAVVLIGDGIDSLASEENYDQTDLNEPEVLLRDKVSSARTRQILSASLDGSIRCWDPYDMKTSFQFDEKDSEMTCMVASKRFQKIFTGHLEGFVKVWSINAGDESAIIAKANGPVICLAVGAVRNQEVLLAGSSDGSVFVWEVNFDHILQGVPFQLTLVSEIQEEVTALLFCNGSFLGREGHEFFVAGVLTGQINVWSFAKKALMCSFKGHSDAVCSLTMHGCVLFSGSDDTLLRMWNILSPGETYELGVLRPPNSKSSSGSESPIVCLDPVPGRGLVLSGAADGTIIVWDYTTFEDQSAYDAYGKIVFRYKVDGCIKCLRCWPDRKALICGTAEGKLIVIDLPSEVFVVN